jgi:hypothetical protein
MICNGAPPVVIVPTDLTVARIRRANPSLSKEAARQMAAELHDIIAGVRKYCAARPGYSAADENDIVQTMMRGVVGDPPGDAAARAAAYDAGANDSIYLAVMLTDPDDPDDSDNNLFERFIRLFDRVNGTDVVGESGLDDKPAAKKPTPYLVRNDLPPFDALKQAVIAAVLLARKGEGPDPKRILDHAAAFRDATGLNFLMEATEAHHAALFDLVQNAGIPVKMGDSM